MDYKVLESLMIPDYDIANEGFGSKVISILKSTFNFFMQIIKSVIKFIDIIINKLKLKKTIHNDKETYLKSRQLSKKWYGTLRELSSWLPDQMGLMMTKCFSMNTYNIRFDPNIYHNYINEIENEYEEFNKKFENMKNDIKDNILYFTEVEHNAIISRLEKSKEKMQKTADNIRKNIDEQLGDSDTLANTKTQDEINEQQKRITEFTSYITKYQTLFANVEKFVMSNVSSDIITEKDKIKYEYH